MSGQDQQKKRGWAAKAEAAKAAKASAAADVATEAMEDEDFTEEEYVPTEADGGMFGDVPAKKAKAFWPSAKRLMGLLKPERIGVSSQVWLLRPFTERTVLEMGFGAYGVRDQLDRLDAEAERVTRLTGLASIGMRYRINDTWRAQLTWNRVITDYHRDSDVFLLGAGVTF